MFPRIDAEISTPCQANVANEKRLRADQNRFSEEWERYWRERDVSVPKLSTNEEQFWRLNGIVTAICASGTRR